MKKKLSRRRKSSFTNKTYFKQFLKESNMTHTQFNKNLKEFLNDSDMSIERFRLIIMYFTKKPDLYFKFNNDPKYPKESIEANKAYIYYFWLFNKHQALSDKIIKIQFSTYFIHFFDNYIFGQKGKNLLKKIMPENFLIILLMLYIYKYLIYNENNDLIPFLSPFLKRNPKLQSLFKDKLPTFDPIYSRQRKPYKKYDHHCLFDIDSNLHDIFLEAEKKNWSIGQLRTILLKYTPNNGIFKVIPNFFGRDIQAKHLIRETGELRDSPGEIAKAIVHYSEMTDKVNFTSIYNTVTRKTAKKRSSTRSRSYTRNGQKGEDYYKKSSLDWLKDNVMNDPYINNVWMKKIDNAKKGYSQYEYAFFEPANRGENYIGKGVIGMKTYHCSGASMDSKELLELFPIVNNNQERIFKKKFAAYQHYLSLLANTDYEKNHDYYDCLSEEVDLLLEDALTYLVDANGFLQIKY